MKKIFLGIACFIVLVPRSGGAQTSAAEFYKGKSVRIIVGNSVGGAMDDWARFIALSLSFDAGAPAGRVGGLRDPNRAAVRMNPN